MEYWHSRAAPDEEFESPTFGLHVRRAPTVSAWPGGSFDIEHSEVVLRRKNS
jgi:hypothetical protein